MTTTIPKLAVVIPLYNKEVSISRAINSVLKQTIDFQQLVIVNDGSTDNSLTVVEQIQDPRIKIISQLNKGVSAARNTGVKATDADYVCFLDADDEWQPYFLEEVTALININKQAGLFCIRYDEVDEYGKRFIGQLVNIADDFRGQLADFFTAYRYNRSLFHPSASCINIQTFKAVGGFPEGVKIGEDIYLALQLAISSAVMFSVKPASTVFRNAENRTVIREKLAIPYHIQYFFDSTRKDVLQKNPTLKIFLLYNTTIFGLYAAQTANRKLAIETAKLLFKHKLSYGIVVLLGACLPTACINLLKKLRNKKTLSYEN